MGRVGHARVGPGASRTRAGRAGDGPRSAEVAVVMGSASDLPVMRETATLLAELGIPCEVRVLSAHRTPDAAAEFARTAAARGLKVLIAAAGGAAHLAGTLAAHSTLPVIGVPLSSGALGGLDALLSTVQMPPGVPVATVGLDGWGARNAAVLAAQMLALGDPARAAAVAAFRARQAEQAAAQDRDVQAASGPAG